MFSSLQQQTILLTVYNHPAIWKGRNR